MNDNYEAKYCLTISSSSAVAVGWNGLIGFFHVQAPYQQSLAQRFYLSDLPFLLYMLALIYLHLALQDSCTPQ